MATTSKTTATTINDTWAIASFAKANEFLGFSSFDTSNVILTNRQSMSIYKVVSFIFCNANLKNFYKYNNCNNINNNKINIVVLVVVQYY